MEFIIDFYNNLDTLNLIIFWGIIIVIILLLIFSFILMSKNKKLSKIVQNKHIQEDLPIKEQETKEENNQDIIISNIEEDNTILPELPIISEIEESNPIKTEQEFIAEEHIKKYNQEVYQQPIIKENLEEEINKQNNYSNTSKNISKEIEIPTKPYQRNVLREMSLSQTSPIGITKPINKEDKIIEKAKDLEDSLNGIEDKEELTRDKNMIINKTIKKELSEIDDSSNRKTEISFNKIERQIPIDKKIVKENEVKYERNYNQHDHQQKTPKKEIDIEKINTNHLQYSTKTIDSYKENNISKQTTFNTLKQTNEEKTENYSYTKNEYIPPQVRELLNVPLLNETENRSKSTSEKYLEEVSRKLAEAEIQDEIERTDYELEQEENAIISYKELMEKKDSIQTIEEEEAVISIEELMNRNNQPKEEIHEEVAKLYNISEEEENDNFLKELKQFRNDL